METTEKDKNINHQKNCAYNLLDLQDVLYENYKKRVQMEFYMTFE